MSSCRSLSNLAKRSKIYLYKSHKCYSTSIETNTTKSHEIIIPYRIQRGPTDILKALSSTISKDYTAPQYKYEDDPYFIPASNISKRAFALSKESGRKAARYFLERYPELFKCNKSEPHIEAFDPPFVYTEENVSSADTLATCIANLDVDNSITVYNILKTKDIPVPQEVKQDLLELLCFYNGRQPPDEDYYEERYFARDDRNGQRWNDKGVAETLFQEMEQNSKSCSALIAGAAKFQDAKRAFSLYEEMKTKELIPTVEAFNGLISIAYLVQELGESRYKIILGLLNDMQFNGVMPNLYTMNAVLEVLARSRRWRKSQNAALRVLSEMKRLNIEPSLGTYSQLLTIFYTDQDSDSGVLQAVLNEVEGKEFTARHPLDVTFFNTAMEASWKVGHNIDFAYRINNLLKYKNNCKLLGNAFSESRYFKSFFKLLSDVEDLDKFMEVYEKYVPNIYTPEPSVMFDILQNIHFTGLYKYLPQICSDVLMFEHTERENILALAMEAAGIVKHEKKVQEELVHIVWKIVEKLNIRLQSGRFNFNWSGQTLGNVLNTFVNGEDLEKTWAIIEQLVNEEQRIVGYPEKETLLKVCKFFLLNKEYDKAKVCAKYAIKGAYPNFAEDFKNLAEDMYQKEKLSTKQRIQVEEIQKLISTADDSSDTSDSSDSSSSDSSDSSSSDEEDAK